MADATTAVGCKMALAVGQMVYYIKGVKKYAKKLEEFADKIEGYADSDKDKYMAIRAHEPAFYSYYQNLKQYDVCTDDINRAKGITYGKYGTILRTSQRTRRGFAPLSMVRVNARYGAQAIKETAAVRATAINNEEARSNEFYYAKWSAIASAPTGAEGGIARGFSPLIEATMSSLKSMGHGFNSAGAMFGTALDQRFKVGAKNDEGSSITTASPKHEYKPIVYNESF